MAAQVHVDISALETFARAIEGRADEAILLNKDWPGETLLLPSDLPASLELAQQSETSLSGFADYLFGYRESLHFFALGAQMIAREFSDLSKLSADQINGVLDAVPEAS